MKRFLIGLFCIFLVGLGIVWGQGFGGGYSPPPSTAGGTCATLGGDVTGTCGANTVAKLSGLTAHQVPISEASSAMVGASPGVSTTCLMSLGVSSDPAFQACTATAISPTAFASLGASPNSTTLFCSDCTVTSSIDNTAAGSGAGCFVGRVGGAWKCYAF